MWTFLAIVCVLYAEGQPAPFGLALVVMAGCFVYLGYGSPVFGTER